MGCSKEKCDFTPEGDSVTIEESHGIRRFAADEGIVSMEEIMSDIRENLSKNCGQIACPGYVHVPGNFRKIGITAKIDM